MKKIIATVLAMVMALALCVTAFAADIEYTAYDKTGKKIAEKVTYTAEKATYNKTAGTGNVAYYDVAGLGLYVVASDAKTYDLKLTTDGKAPLYLTTITNPNYVAKATVFKTVGDSCEQLDVELLGYTYKDTFYTSTNADGDATTYYAADSKNGTANVLVGSELVKVAVLGTNLEFVGHDWKVSKYDDKDNAAEYTCKECKTVAKVYPSKDAAVAAGMAKWDTTRMIGWNYTAKGASTTTTTTNGSPKTFDAGIAMYAGMALMSVAGSAVVIGKKKEF